MVLREIRPCRGLLVALALLVLAAATLDTTPQSQAAGEALLHGAVAALFNESAGRQEVTDLLARARTALAEAQSIYPGNTWTRDIAKGME